MGLNWLLLRGLVREQRHWGDFPARLAAAGGQVLTLDLPGVGTESGRASPTNISAIVEDIRARFVGRPGEWGIFAPSLGGMIALDWVSRHPEDFRAAVVCNTSASDLAGPFERFSWAAVGTVLRGLVVWNPVERERLILELVSNTDGGRAHAEEFAGFTPRIGVGVLVRQLWAGSRAKAPSSLSVPLTVLCSEGDRLCSPMASRRLSERLNARLEVHPSAGHDLPLDDPEWVIARVLGAGDACAHAPSWGNRG